MAGKRDGAVDAPAAHRPPRAWVWLSYALALAGSGLSRRPAIAGLLLLAAAAGAALPAAAAVFELRIGWMREMAYRFRALPAVRLAGFRRLVWLRFLLVGCQAVTVLVTRQLWQARDYPPNLPVPGVPVFEINYAWLMLASLAAVLIWPRIGIWVHLGVLGLAFLADQTRLQPEFISLAMLLVATNVPRYGPTVGRWHLIAMWSWAGINKLLSTGFATGAAVWIYEGLPVALPAVKGIFAWLIAGTELGIGLTMLIPRLRRLGVVAAFALHGMILLVLSPWGKDFNDSVWAWNLALPVAAAVLFWPQGTPREPVGRRAMAVQRGLALAILVIPLGFYFGVTDAYVAHHLYSDSTARAYCTPLPCSNLAFEDTWSALQVPLPPEPRLFNQYFLRRCRPGESLMFEPRQTRILIGLNTRPTLLTCPGG